MTELLVLSSLVFFVILFVSQIVNTEKFKKARKQVFTSPVACAGSPCEGNKETQDVIFFDKKSLKTVDGKLIDISDYETYIISGNSMLLSGIRDKDLVLTQSLFINEETLFPKILVLVRDTASKEDAVRKNDYALYKVRRTWYAGTLNGDMESSIDKIYHSKPFTDLRKKYPDNFLDIEIMKQDFRKRLATYKSTYECCEDSKNENNKVIISTTLHTREGSGYFNKVTFSIHPQRLIKGEVKHVFHLLKNK